MPGPAIVQSDRTVLLEVAHPGFEEAREALASFAELEKSPEHRDHPRRRISSTSDRTVSPTASSERGLILSSVSSSVSRGS